MDFTRCGPYESLPLNESVIEFQSCTTLECGPWRSSFVTTHDLIMMLPLENRDATLIRKPLMNLRNGPSIFVNTRRSNLRQWRALILRSTSFSGPATSFQERSVDEGQQSPHLEEPCARSGCSRMCWTGCLRWCAKQEQLVRLRPTDHAHDRPAHSNHPRRPPPHTHTLI